MLVESIPCDFVALHPFYEFFSLDNQNWALMWDALDWCCMGSLQHNIVKTYNLAFPILWNFNFNLLFYRFLNPVAFFDTKVLITGDHGDSVSLLIVICLLFFIDKSSDLKIAFVNDIDMCWHHTLSKDKLIYIKRLFLVEL